MRCARRAFCSLISFPSLHHLEGITPIFIRCKQAKARVEMTRMICFSSSMMFWFLTYFLFRMQDCQSDINQASLTSLIAFSFDFKCDGNMSLWRTSSMLFENVWKRKKRNYNENKKYWGCILNLRLFYSYSHYYGLYLTFIGFPIIAGINKAIKTALRKA